MTIPINALITTPRGLSFVCLCVCVQRSCDVRLVPALHRWVYLAARRACNLPTFIHLSPLLSLALSPSVWCFVLLIESSVVDLNDSQSLCVHNVKQDSSDMPRICNLQTLNWLSGTFVSAECSSLNNFPLRLLFLVLLRLPLFFFPLSCLCFCFWGTFGSELALFKLQSKVVEFKSISECEQAAESVILCEKVCFFVCGSVLVLRSWSWNASSFLWVVGPSHQINLESPTLAWTCLKVSLCPFFAAFFAFY